MMYSNGFFQDRLRSNTSLNVIYAKDKGDKFKEINKNKFNVNLRLEI